MNVAMRKFFVDSSLIALGWPHVKSRLEIESIRFAEGIIQRTRRYIESRGGAGEYSYCLGFAFGLSYGIVGQLPEDYIPQLRPGEVWAIDIFIHWDMHLRNLTREPVLQYVQGGIAI